MLRCKITGEVIFFFLRLAEFYSVGRKKYGTLILLNILDPAVDVERTVV